MKNSPLRKHLASYWILAVVGIGISLGLATIIRAFIVDIPPGVPLGRLGLLGAITQVGLLVLPFVFASVFTGCAFYGSIQRRASKKEVGRLTAAVGLTVTVILVLFWVLSGAWFGLLYGTIWSILFFLFMPPLVITALFGILFPATIAVLASGRSKPSKG